MRGVLHDIFYGRIDHRKAASDGARFHQALVDVSFDIGVYDMADPSKFERERLGTLTRTFEASFEPDEKVAQA